MRRMKFISFAFALLISLAVSAQSNSHQRLPFKTGETLTFDMYFRYGFINAKAGASTLTVKEDTYNNRDVFRFTLHAKSSGAAKSFFSMDDTLTSYMSKDLKPLVYMKDAHENKDHTIERAYYNYPASGKVELQAKRIRNDDVKFDTLLVSEQPIYDMLNIIFYARTFDYSTMQKGDKRSITYFTGRRMENMDIVYRGIETVSANDGREYFCVKLVMVLNEKAFENGNEAMTVYISNDQNKVPIRIDSKLKHGSTRIIIKEYKGVG